ncbi:hypothetical protein ACRQ5D_04995 [Mucilaginibacter sp. P25]|uniref:hypothetical protein n=1 Tax=Mucilaginibacter sp. P25 TaxID=3423945 RepID=UPI003D7B045F
MKGSATTSIDSEGKKLKFTVEDRLRHYDSEIPDDNQHHYIQFSENSRPGAVTEAAFMIIEHFFKDYQPRNKWRKEQRLFTVSQVDDKNALHISGQFNYLKVAASIREHGDFDPYRFGLLAMECQWMDFTLDMSFNVQFRGAKKRTACFRLWMAHRSNFMGQIIRSSQG